MIAQRQFARDAGTVRGAGLRRALYIPPPLSARRQLNLPARPNANRGRRPPSAHRQCELESHRLIVGRPTRVGAIELRARIETRQHSHRRSRFRKPAGSLCRQMFSTASRVLRARRSGSAVFTGHFHARRNTLGASARSTSATCLTSARALPRSFMHMDGDIPVIERYGEAGPRTPRDAD